MKYAIKLAAVTVVGLSSVARADHAIEGATGSAEIINNCQKTVYLHSVGDSDGPEHVIPPGQSWSERYKQKEGGGGPSLKIRTEGTAIIQFEYSAFRDQVWYNLSYVDCWNQATHSGDRCPFWNDSFVVESPGGQPNIPCPTGKSCNYVYRCPYDDHGPGVSTIAGGPVVNMLDPTQNIKLHLCPCEKDPNSGACQMAKGPGLPVDESRTAGMEGINSCPGLGGAGAGSTGSTHVPVIVPGPGAPQYPSSEDDYVPTNPISQYDAPDGYGSPDAYGSPDGYGSPDRYGSPDGYGSSDGYDSPIGYPFQA